MTPCPGNVRLQTYQKDTIRVKNGPGRQKTTFILLRRAIK